MTRQFMDPNESLVRENIKRIFHELVDVEFFGSDHRFIRVSSSVSVRAWEDRLLDFVKSYLACPDAQLRYDGAYSVIIALDGNKVTRHY